MTVFSRPLLIHQMLICSLKAHRAQSLKIQKIDTMKSIIPIGGTGVEMLSFITLEKF